MPFVASAEGFRIASLHAELTRKGPGLLLRDIERGKDEQIAALQQIVQSVAPDILLLTKVDFDAELRTARALQRALGFDHAFALPPNSMVPTSLDLDGDGRKGDRQSWVRYAGEGAMLLLSQHPVRLRFHMNDLLWKDAPNAQMPMRASDEPFPSIAAHEALKLVSIGLWVVDVMPEGGAPLTLLVFQNQTPVFDGPEDMNGLRNRAQLGLVRAVMESVYGTFPTKRFAVMGNANLDPARGVGDRGAIAAFLADRRVQDLRPQSALGGEATAFWDKPGPMRVSYILPSAEWQVDRAEVVWPQAGLLRTAAEQASRHRMIWLELRPPP
ncbi:endonuclease/exonuclease/phosphatase family protein [Planktotalea arctica]|uniref:endonuclease/exonuclease/phosphatase family protein n=1 Tax=Planktotalea arctica TaxID=1481893 RepID=UPI000A175A26|nr:endonuclease/exonuclease/phosphatase family protein [Planktotalea arctica]